MVMKDRLILFLAHLGMGQTKFEEKVGLSRGFVNNIGESIKEKTIKKITDVYPELNVNWLKTGEGEMLKSDQKIGSVSNSTVVGSNVSGNGIQITHNDLSGMIELQKGYQNMMKKSQEQIDRLLSIIEKKGNAT